MLRLGKSAVKDDPKIADGRIEAKRTDEKEEVRLKNSLVRIHQK